VKEKQFNLAESFYPFLTFSKWAICTVNFLFVFQKEEKKNFSSESLADLCVQLSGRLAQANGLFLTERERERESYICPVESCSINGISHRSLSLSLAKLSTFGPFAFDHFDAGRRI
jgi:hypothetical protein